MTRFDRVALDAFVFVLLELFRFSESVLNSEIERNMHIMRFLEAAAHVHPTASFFRDEERTCRRRIEEQQTRATVRALQEDFDVVERFDQVWEYEVLEAGGTEYGTVVAGRQARDVEGA